ncbi:MAG: glycosyltransferase [Candidatus Erginobacter occultus]|nr:glycosyltransferase [Candidatus Erginobacter occultus]
MSPIDVSIVVTTRNEEKHIPSCLESVRRQDYPAEKYEIIIVDNNSTDRTKEIASRCTPLVFNHGPERSAQRNFGIERARGKYILYLDADMTLGDGLLKECVGKCDSEGLSGLYIPERVIGKGFWIKARDFERSFYNGTCIDAARFVRRETALEIGGFDENLNGPEDWDFDRRLRVAGKVGVASAVIFHDEGRFNLRSYLKKKSYYSRGFAAYIAKWGKSNLEIKKQFGLRYRYLGVFLENGKWRRLLAHPLLAGGMFFLRLVVGIVFLVSRIHSGEKP